MDPVFWILLAKALVPSLVSLGKPELAGVLNDAIAAFKAGKNIDDAMKEFVARWEAEGEPSFDSIEKARQDIQARIDG